MGRRAKDISRSLRLVVIRRDRAMCCWCAKRFNPEPDTGFCSWLEIDHVRPVCLGGKTIRRNLQVLCSLCNRMKGTRPASFRPTLIEIREYHRDKLWYARQWRGLYEDFVSPLVPEYWPEEAPYGLG